MKEFFNFLSNPAVVWVLVPVAALIGVFVNKGLKSHYAHKERMARIEAGMEEEEN